MEIRTPASHSTDPESSRLAESMMNRTGKRFNHQERLARMVRLQPGNTAAELGDLTALGQHECSRRLSELNGIWVERGARRKCAVKGTQMVTWYPIQEAWKNGD